MLEGTRGCCVTRPATRMWGGVRAAPAGLHARQPLHVVPCVPCSSLSAVSQKDLAPAAEQLAGGELAPAAWEQRFSLQAIRDLAVAAER